MFSIRSVLALSLAGLQFVAVVAVLFLSYVTSERVLLQHARDLMGDVARSTINHTVAFLAPAEAAADLSQRLARQEVVSSENEGAMERYFFEQLRSHSQFAGIFYGNTNGDFVFVNRDASVAGAPFRIKTIANRPQRRDVELYWRDGDYTVAAHRSDPGDGYDPRTRPWYGRAVEAGGVTWTDPYIFFSSQEPGITVATPVTGTGGELRGVVGIDIEISALSTFLADLQIGQHGSAFILSDSGDVIAHPEPAKIKTRGTSGDILRFTRIDELDDPLAKAAAASFNTAQAGRDGLKERAASFTFGRETYHAVASSLPGTRWPWTVITYVPENDFLGAIKDNRRNGVLLAALVAAVTAMIGLAIARSITRPVGALAGQADRISGGDISPMPPLRTHYRELQRTGFAFGRMTEWLNRRNAENQALTDELRAASRELEARVEERTRELNHANAQLREEAELRAQQADKLERANRQAELLTRELNHRVKNVFAVVSAVLSLGARSARSVEDLASTTRRRIDALSKAHSATQGHPGRAGSIADLTRLAELVLAPYAGDGEARIDVSGVRVRLGGEVATALGLILHELATNAAKYGALRAEAGRVELSWTLDEEGPRVLHLVWRETGGPVPQKPADDKRGFGTKMVEQIIAQYHATYHIDWRNEGVVVTLNMVLPADEPADDVA
ncbi:sensor histidine kinase [Afifella marina]|uniref:histidine kinase n=1 Tax=Afifella marina DSM 2698 TaxID=1120955 RepID=A0A1G5NRH5_AFIMA|nr:sensor histidine kinase [Afifella marina]MBK1624745.1 hypothetical protein [Afifella marina DSM 2698]MBK1628557.1 hypothetical protein [Afifella marina]MBK5915916.1 hypothetical protein [Afifella marina]RAI20549.1 hypothetical protein CH311_09115 [Afifella marina DSM 2698]SCZ39764.1 Two-component sensor histidine kinase, contains HisKA and HATPase domains [Afifella marina DSM 2698]